MFLAGMTVGAVVGVVGVCVLVLWALGQWPPEDDE